MNEIKAGIILTTVGSLRRAKIRLASNQETQKNEIAELSEERFEIVSMSGTISNEFGMHVHIAVADANGEVCGGHMLEGCEVFTTCECVIGDIRKYQFERHLDVHTGHKELVVVKSAQRELGFGDGDSHDDAQETTPTGKKARRMRQMRMIEQERKERAMNERGEGEHRQQRKGIFSRIATMIVPPPTPMVISKIADEV